MGEHAQGLLAGIRQLETIHDIYKRAPRKSWILQLLQEIRGTALQLLNRRIRVRPYGGVRGRPLN
jgi:hypothetical protein